MNIKKTLIANRGEIALRIVRMCKAMGVKTVALCPLKGEESNFIETVAADEFYYLERAGASGYLDQSRILEIAREAGADAIHPGYGFLAENWEFALRCGEENVTFIGPHFEILRKLEDKLEAKKIAEKIGLPVLPASPKISDEKDLVIWADRIKPPFVLKAVHGGGGIGIRMVNEQTTTEDLADLSLAVRREAMRAFGNQDFFIEKCLTDARHIEFQVLGDGVRAVHLGERDCSIQRHFQKLLEETPSMFLSEALRREMGAWAVKICEELHYDGAATVEFLVGRDGKYYFLEVNPRIQVEHPITEAVTGIDIVEQQIRIARGERLSLAQDGIGRSGWAIEARVNAEDPRGEARPSSGVVTKYVAPYGSGISVHSFLHDGQEIYPYFNGLLAKVVATGKDRGEAIGALEHAMHEIIIEGVATNIPFLQALLKNKEFMAGNFSTDFVERKMKATLPVGSPRQADFQARGSTKEIKAPIAGIISSISVVPGDAVRRGQKLLTLSAMKMENEILSEYDGIVREIRAQEDQRVGGGEVLIVIT